MLRGQCVSGLCQEICMSITFSLQVRKHLHADGQIGRRRTKDLPRRSSIRDRNTVFTTALLAGASIVSWPRCGRDCILVADV